MNPKKKSNAAANYSKYPGFDARKIIGARKKTKLIPRLLRRSNETNSHSEPGHYSTNDEHGEYQPRQTK